MAGTDGGHVPGLPSGFEFRRTLGRGSTGWVVLARDRQLDRLVAVKIIPTKDPGDPAVRRLEREGTVLARLEHPAIVTVFRLVRGEGSVSLVMEYLDAGDLRTAIQDRRLSGAGVVAVLRQVADALSCAAHAGITHRDVKPANVVLAVGGRAALADFGLARLPGTTAGFRTAAGVPSGTPLYMAPEQIVDPDVDTPAIDSYAFGVLAYQLLTGRTPYRATNLKQLVDAHLRQAPTPPTDFRPEIPDSVAVALVGALSKDAALRIPPAALADALNAYPGDFWNALLPAPQDVVPADEPPAGGQTGPEVRGLALTGTGDGADGLQSSHVLMTSAPQPEPAGRPSVVGPPRAAGWIRPPVYMPARQRSRKMIAVPAAIVLGVAVGLAMFIVWFHR